MIRIIHAKLYIVIVYLFFNVKCEKTDKSKVPFLLESGYINIHVDGYCINNGRPNAKAGVGVWFNYNHPYNDFKPVSGRPTNINADLQAAIFGFQTARKHGIKELLIHTDSKFVINCMTKWIRNWELNGYKTQQGNDVKNQETIRKLAEVMQDMRKVYWVHVRGPRLETGNIEADALAQKGAALYEVKENKESEKDSGKESSELPFDDDGKDKTDNEPKKYYNNRMNYRQNNYNWNRRGGRTNFYRNPFYNRTSRRY